MFIPMMESTNRHGDPSGELNSYHPDGRGASRPPAAPDTAPPPHSPLHYVSPSDVPFYYPKSAPPSAQALLMFPGRPGGRAHPHDFNKRSRDVPAPQPSSAVPFSHSVQVQSTVPPGTKATDHSYHPAQAQQQPAKRSRLSTYTPPRNPTKSANLLAAMGSLAAASAPPAPAGTTATTAAGMARVPLRRQLSGSNLEGFIGHHDSMDVEESADTRPRSMSF